MPTITVVQEGGVVAIAADQATTTGSCTHPGIYKARAGKIVRIGDSYVGVPGLTAHVRVVESLARAGPGEFDLSSVDAVFETFRRLQRVPAEEYCLVTNTDEYQPAHDSAQLCVLIANRTGIYGVGSYRGVTQYERFWALGSGCQLALGAMEALYGAEGLSAPDSAERGGEVAALFDQASGTPVDSYTVQTVLPQDSPDRARSTMSTAPITG